VISNKRLAIGSVKSVRAQNLYQDLQVTSQNHSSCYMEMSDSYRDTQGLNLEFAIKVNGQLQTQEGSK
jgi:hypothetical protein